MSDIASIHYSQEMEGVDMNFRDGGHVFIGREFFLANPPLHGESSDEYLIKLLNLYINRQKKRLGDSDTESTLRGPG